MCAGTLGLHGPYRRSGFDPKRQTGGSYGLLWYRNTAGASAFRIARAARGWRDRRSPRSTTATGPGRAAKAPHHLPFGLKVSIKVASGDPQPTAPAEPPAPRATGHAAIPYGIRRPRRAGARRAPGAGPAAARPSLSRGTSAPESRRASGDWAPGGRTHTVSIQYRVWRRFAVRGSTTRQDPSTGSD